jgi:hyperosmotically inducible periplasmic protein
MGWDKCEFWRVHPIAKLWFRTKIDLKRRPMQRIRGLFMISSLTVAIATIMGLSGCASWEQRRSDERSAGRVVDDTGITQRVQKELRIEPVYKFNDVDVRTFAGVVQLSGFVNTEEQKRRAEEIAQQTPGVTQVVNNITLKPTGVIAPTPTGRVNPP